MYVKIQSFRSPSLHFLFIVLHVWHNCIKFSLGKCFDFRLRLEAYQICLTFNEFGFIFNENVHRWSPKRFVAVRFLKFKTRWRTKSKLKRVWRGHNCFQRKCWINSKFIWIRFNGFKLFIFGKNLYSFPHWFQINTKIPKRHCKRISTFLCFDFLLPVICLVLLFLTNISCFT